MTDTLCVRCARPVHDTAYTCAGCVALLRRHLEGVVRIAGDITLTVAKLARVQRGGSHEIEREWYRGDGALFPHPLPVDLDAAARHDAAVGELTTWARHIASERGQQIPFGFAVSRRGVVSVSHPLVRAAVFLVEGLVWLAHRAESEEAWPVLLVACMELQRVVDTRPPGELIGMCACGTARYSTESFCPRCRAEDLAYSRADLDAGRDELIVTASEAARYVMDTGIVITSTDRLRKLIWAWADRGHLVPVDDVPRYRLGDVLRRVLDSPALLRAA